MELFFPSLLGEYLKICDPTLKDCFLGQNFATWRGKLKRPLRHVLRLVLGGGEMAHYCHIMRRKKLEVTRFRQ
jgi:hypothetical protein